MNTVTESYSSNGYQEPSETFLDEDTYRKVLPRWVKACVDAVLYLRTSNETFMVLGKRKIEPQKDWWIFGGRILVSDPTIQHAIARKLREEIGLNIDLSRIPDSPARVQFYKWGEDGTVSLAPTFLVEITWEEYAKMHGNVSASPEYSELMHVSTAVVVTSETLHPALRDCARTLMEFTS